MATKKTTTNATATTTVPDVADAPKAGDVIQLKPFRKEALLITIRGDEHCDLVLNKMTDEAVDEIRTKQTKEGAKGTKAAINMWQRLIGGLHWMDSFSAHPYLDDKGKPEYTEKSYYELLKSNRVGYDASGIKKGLCEAAIRVLGESKCTIINANLQVIPEKKNLIPIEFGETEIDESVITNWKGNAFLTYRTVFRDWACTLRVEYLPDNLSRDQVIEMFQAMGFAGGLGAHRVGLKGGTNGKFHVEKVVQL